MNGEAAPEEEARRLRERETPEEAKARRRASLLDDLPDLPEDRERKLRASETPEETRARHRASLLSDLPELPPEEGSTVQPVAQTVPATRPAEQPSAEADEDPFADIHWNSDQTTFTIRL